MVVNCVISIRIAHEMILARYERWSDTGNLCKTPEDILGFGGNLGWSRILPSTISTSCYVHNTEQTIESCRDNQSF